MPCNPYDQKRNPYKYAKWEQKYGHYNPCGHNPYDQSRNPKKYSDWNREYGCHTPRRKRTDYGYGYGH